MLITLYAFMQRHQQKSARRIAVLVVFLRLTVYRIIEGRLSKVKPTTRTLWKVGRPPPYRPYSNPLPNGKASSSSGPMPPWSGSHVKTERSI